MLMSCDFKLLYRSFFYARASAVFSEKHSVQVYCNENLLRVSEANKVPIICHISVTSTTFKDHDFQDAILAQYVQTIILK